MKTEQEQHPQSHLFTLRVWEESLGDGQVEWRGRVQELASGQTLFFHGWPGLISTLERLIAGPAGSAEASRGQFQPTYENSE